MQQINLQVTQQRGPAERPSARLRTARPRPLTSASSPPQSWFPFFLLLFTFWRPPLCAGCGKVFRNDEVILYRQLPPQLPPLGRAPPTLHTGEFTLSRCHQPPPSVSVPLPEPPTGPWREAEMLSRNSEKQKSAVERFHVHSRLVHWGTQGRLKSPVDPSLTWTGQNPRTPVFKYLQKYSDVIVDATQ